MIIDHRWLPNCRSFGFNCSAFFKWLVIGVYDLIMVFGGYSFGFENW
jgi:hypothetical protein